MFFQKNTKKIGKKNYDNIITAKVYRAEKKRVSVPPGPIFTLTSPLHLGHLPS